MSNDKFTIDEKLFIVTALSNENLHLELVKLGKEKATTIEEGFLKTDCKTLTQEIIKKLSN